MATVQIFHEEDGRTSTVTAVLRTSIVSTLDMVRDSYLLISTSLRQADGTAFPTYLVRDLTDIAPGGAAAANFTELIEGYIEYFVEQAQLGQSSSSSSSSTSSEGYSESSSSSGGYSESSSSSSGGYSESSSTSGGYSESSSSSGL